jgi:hypothetical protein
MIAGYRKQAMYMLHKTEERLNDRYIPCGIGTMAISLTFYVSCWAFIIVECFLDVFHLPDSAFDVPQWSQYFPHTE